MSTLIYAMGPEAENIFNSFTFERDKHKKDLDAVLNKFNDYFIPKKNIIHERACFYQCIQRPGEKAEMFIHALYELAESCDFGAQKQRTSEISLWLASEIKSSQGFS